MKKKGFTLIELLVVIAIIAMLLAILMPALNKVKKIAQRVVCGTNLKGLGTAQAVYANDYEDQYTKQGGTLSVIWGPNTFEWQIADRSWSGAPGDTTQCTVGASLYLLVREADVSPKSFVCGGAGQTAFDGQNDFSLDLVELWDFGHTAYNGTGARNCVSYGFQMPYSRNAATGAASASFATMADKNPWFDNSKLEESDLASSSAADYAGKVADMFTYYSTASGTGEKWQRQIANTYGHGREGQNVTFGDGHSSYEKVADVGVRHDNIYTQQGAGTGEWAVRVGLTGLGIYKILGAVPGNDPTSCSVIPRRAGDTLLINDDD
jgi:prepilin-type N-terminal cleavage/methylation domain-containing protein